MEFKGTPAPWVVVDNGHYFHFKSTNDGHRIGDVCSSTHVYDESIHNTKGVAYANACLIASSPELLEQLIRLHNKIASYKPDDNDDLDIVGAVIAKALGQQ